MTINNDNRNFNANRDPLTGATGLHPLSTGIGADVGGLDGTRGVGAIEPTRGRASCWSENRSGRDSVEQGSSFADYGPAWGFGLDARDRYPGRDFDDVEPELSRDWATGRGESILSWEWARHAARDAWNRIGSSN